MKLFGVDFSQFRMKTLSPIIGIWSINLILFIGIYIVAFQLFQSYTEYAALRETITDTKLKVDLVEGNRQLTSEQIDTYNEVLGNLIPDQESYFSVISSLELISLKTGFKLTRYTINLSATTADKLSLIVEGTGSQEDFMKLMNEYQYAGDRLVTNESVEFFPSRLENVKLSLNFYHKKTGKTINGEVALTQQDIEFMNEVVTNSKK